MVGSSVKVKCGFYGHRSSNSVFFLASIFFFLGNKPLRAILDCYHRLILVLISVWLTTPSTLEDKVIHVRPRTPSCFASFNTCCHEPYLLVVSFLRCLLRGLKPKSYFFGESREQALTRLSRSVEKALSTHPSRLQRTTKCNTCMVLGVYQEQHSSGFLLNHTTSFLGLFSPTV